MSENGSLRRGRPGYDQQGILDVAVGAFNQYGYDATSMGVLADRLGLSKSAIYHHFASKDEILERALDEALSGLEGVLDEADAARVPRSRPARPGAARCRARARRQAPVRDPAAPGARQHRRGAARARATPCLRQAGHPARDRGARRGVAAQRHRRARRRAAALRHDQLDRRVVPPGRQGGRRPPRRRRHRGRARRLAHAHVEPRRGAARR